MAFRKMLGVMVNASPGLIRDSKRQQPTHRCGLLSKLAAGVESVSAAEAQANLVGDSQRVGNYGQGGINGAYGWETAGIRDV